jgi:hypothetical protein
LLDPSVTTTATAAAYIALRVTHALGDHPIQSSWAALHKGQPDDEQLAAGAHPWRGWSACGHHIFTYGLTQAVGLLIALAISPLTVAGAAAALAISLSTHAVIDRRWLVRALIRARHKQDWADGPYLIDQSLHHGFIGLAVAAAGLVTAAGSGSVATIAAGGIGVVSLLLVAAGLLIEKVRARRLVAGHRGDRVLATTESRGGR